MKGITLLRVFTSTIFLYAGFNHLLRPGKILKKVSTTSAYEWLGNPQLFAFCIMASGIVMVVAGVMLAFGYRYKLASWLLLFMLIPITASVQLENFGDLGPFFKNVAIAGSLLFILNYKNHENETHLNAAIVGRS